MLLERLNLLKSEKLLKKLLKPLLIRLSLRRWKSKDWHLKKKKGELLKSC